MSTIRPMMYDPVAIITPLITSMTRPDVWLNKGFMYSPLTSVIAHSSPTGSADTIQRARRPCAVSVFTSRLTSFRSRMVSVTRSRTSAALLPVLL